MKDYIEALREIKKENKDFKITLSRKEVLELVNEFDRLNNIINGMEMSEEEILNLKVMVCNLDLSIDSKEKLINQISKISFLLQQKENIIKEVREYIENDVEVYYVLDTKLNKEFDKTKKVKKDLLEILDKEKK